MSFQSFIRKSILKLGYTIRRGDLISEIREMEAAPLSMKHMPDCKVYPNRTAVLADLPKGGVIAEVGVAYGDFSEILFRELNPSTFFAIDFFALIKNQKNPGGKRS